MKQFSRLVNSIEKMVFWFIFASVCLTIGTPISSVVACVVMAIPPVITAITSGISLTKKLIED